MGLISSGMNSCSDIIGCLWSVKFLPVFWNWDLQSHFECDVFVHYFLSLSLSLSLILCSPRRFPSVVPSPESDLMGVQGFCSRVAWGRSTPSHQASGQFGSVPSD